jgi:hypothetical protein
MKTLFFIVLAFASVGCSGQTTANQTAPAAVPAAASKAVSTADLANLKWIEGAWKGTGDVEKPFFELYRFEDDSTLAVDSFDDESLGKVTETSRFVLKDGQFGNSNYAATDITKDSVTFAPIAKARNTFTWRKKSADLWEAVLEWPATESKPAMKRVYQMARIPMPKK